MDEKAKPPTCSGDAGAPEDAFDHVMRLSYKVDYRIADSGGQREAIFRLRYQAYKRDGTVSANASGALSDPYDETAHVMLEDAALTARALDWTVGGMDFADALHLAKAEGCNAMVTFDRRFVRTAKKHGNIEVRML